MKEIAFEKTIVLNDVNMISRTTFINVSKIVLASIEISNLTPLINKF